MRWVSNLQAALYSLCLGHGVFRLVLAIRSAICRCCNWRPHGVACHVGLCPIIRRWRCDWVLRIVIRCTNPEIIPAVICLVWSKGGVVGGSCPRLGCATAGVSSLVRSCKICVMGGCATLLAPGPRWFILCDCFGLYVVFRSGLTLCPSGCCCLPAGELCSSVKVLN